MNYENKDASYFANIRKDIYRMQDTIRTDNVRYSGELNERLESYLGERIQDFAEKNGFSVVREFCGHGIGKRFHEEPQVLHYGKPGTGVTLEAGMIFTIEPMINAGKRDIKQMPDGWTIVTKDRSLSAQWEHTILVTDSGYEVLTVSEKTPAPPAFTN